MSGTRATALIGVAVAVLGAALYVNTLWNPFQFDDEVVIERNPYLRSWRNVVHLFSGEYFVRFQEMSYRPVVSFTYLAESAIWGTRPFGFHLTNVLLHAAVGAAVVVFLTTLHLPAVLVASAAALYVSHPVLTEVVNSAGFREDSLSALGMFLALAFYNRATEGRGSTAGLAASAVCFLVALFAKESALIMPALIVAQDLVLRRRVVQRRRQVVGLAAPAVSAGFYVAIRFMVMRNPLAPEVRYGAGTLLNTLLTMPWIIVRYVRLMVLPMHLNIRYDFMPVQELLDGRFIAGVCVIVALLAYAAWRVRRTPLDAFAILWFFIALAPVLNLVPIGNLMAERFLAVAVLGFCVLVERAVHVAGRRAHVAAWFAVGLIVVAFGMLTVARNRVWGDERALRQQSVIGNPESGRAWDAVAQLAIDRQEWERGKHLERIALERLDRLGQQDSRPVYHLGVCLKNLGELEEARRQFERILPGDSLYYMALLNLAEICRRRGDAQCAEQHAWRAARVEPERPNAWGALAGLYRWTENRYREREVLERLLETLPPGDPNRVQVVKRLRSL